MCKVNFIFSTFLIYFLSLHGTVLAQAETIVKPKSPAISAYNSVAGSTIGQMYLNAPLEVTEKNGEWTKVKIEAWVKSSDITEVTLHNQTTAASSNQETLVIIDHQIKTYNDLNKVYLGLTIQNKTNSTINSWQAFLVAKDISKKEIFRSVIADDKAILPGQSAETGFYWESSEPSYDYLKNAKKEDFSFSIVGAILK